MPHPQPRTRLRSLSIAALIVLLVSCVPFWQTRVSAQNVTVSSTSATISAGTSTSVSVSVTNQTGSSGTFNLSGAAPSGWTVQLSNTSLTLNNGTSQNVTVNIAVPAGTAAGSYTVTVNVSGAANASGFITVTVPAATATSTTGTITISPQFSTVTGAAGQTGISTNITLTNNSGADRTFTLSALNFPSGISARFPVNTILVRNGTSFQFPVFIDFAGNTTVGQNIGVGTIRFTAQGTPPIVGDSFVTFTVTSALSPTTTPTPNICVGTRESNDPGNDKGSARRLLVNEPQDHGICYIGDEDWFVFGAVAGKVYTFDVMRMEFGLDLSLELYNADDQLMAQNDDFFARTPVPGQATATPGPSGDLRPQIKSWRAPVSGDYYLRVRDNLNIGGSGKQYTIVVVGEGYGPTPQTIYEVCRDLYEEDGLPEQAKLLTANESQPGHVLCPVGDADWIKFFGKTGKTYYIYTDTRPYGVSVGGAVGPEPGADTTLSLFDRDGITLIASNDDIENPTAPSQSSLDSEIRFTPTVDGFYFAQVKNSGDIGNQFIKYDLVLKLCIPGQECGRNPVSQIQPTQNPAQAVPTATFTVPATVTPQPTVTPNTTPQANAPTPTASFAVFAQPSGSMVEGRVSGFVDPAFKAVWERNDRPLAEQRVTRSWMWGPSGPVAKAEPFAQVGGGLRQVQYFDKARMEINNPGADRSSQWFVTTGLLVMELVSGRVQIGANEFVQRGAADIPLAGDATDDAGPRYASFAGVTGEQMADRSGQLPQQTINRTGQIGSYAGPERTETRLAHYVSETRHNIPQVFWDYLNARGTIFDGGFHEDTITDWVFTMGYPISEPYWATVRVGGVPRDVLIQPFERRVLTYSPDNPRGWQVEQGNVGRHYYQWRYSEVLP